MNTRLLYSILLPAFLFCFVPRLSSQSIDWVRVGGGSTCNDYAHDVVADSLGNVYMVGINNCANRYGSFELDGGGAIVKYDKDGNVLWGKRVTDGEVKKVAFDYNNKSIYIVGDSAARPWIAKFGLGGVMYRSAAEDDFGSYYSLTVEDNGSVYVGGEKDRFPYVTKFNVQGYRVWEQRFSGQDLVVLSSTLDVRGNLYVIIGYWFPSNDFSLAKLDPLSGDVIWERKIAGNAAVSCLLYEEGGSLLIGGSNLGSLNFGAGSLVGFAGDLGGFIVRVDTSGNFMQAVLIAHSDLGQGSAEITDMVIDPYGDVLIAGSADDNVNIGSKSFELTRREAILVKFNRDLEPIWFVHTGINTEGYAVTANGSDIFLAGRSSGIGIPFPGVPVAPHMEDIFVAKLTGNGPSSAVKEELQEKSFVIAPNPTTNSTRLQLPEKMRVEQIRICDVAGRVVRSIEENLSDRNSIDLNLEGLASGIYYVSLQGEGVSHVQSLIKVSAD